MGLIVTSYSGARFPKKELAINPTNPRGVLATGSEIRPSALPARTGFSLHVGPICWSMVCQLYAYEVVMFLVPLSQFAFPGPDGAHSAPMP